MDFTNQNSLHQTLKNQTEELHKKAHKIPYVANILKNNISLISYVGHLRTLAIIYGTLEHQLENTGNPEIKVFLENYKPKLPLILSDLEDLKANEIKDIIPAINNALSVADNILINSKKNPYRLLGFLYTLEGSLNGGSVLKNHISSTFAFHNNLATRYLGCFDNEFKIFWKSYVENLNTRVIENEHKESIISASKEVFLDMMKIYESLYPFTEKALGNHITSFNPEAGNYPITTNPKEISAALKAGMECWILFPYYEKRYGDRGRRFTVSDSVWLVTLSELSEDDTISQVNWLAKLLAVRGMPTYTMEIQMHLLYAELLKEIPGEKQKYSKLLLAAENIKDQRTSRIHEISFENSNSIFEKSLDSAGINEVAFTKLKRNMGKLIASSIADGKNGISDSRKSLEDWLKNTDDFPEKWILAVDNAYKEIELLFNPDLSC